ncbi:MAG: carboxypeptidase regulatory-like domain-containing protein, partial [Nanoarchaeota archaeon]|nr:carboxypeptidase regulatory-like domain-containing protein [Nanoarchaeota archaeon]
GTTYIIKINDVECSSWSVGNFQLSDPIQLSTKAKLSGVIQDSNGNPINGATVKWTDCSDNIVVSTLTNSNGDFTLSAAAGSYKFKVTVNYDGVLVTYTFKINDQECGYWAVGNYAFPEPLKLSSDFTLSGYIKDMSNNPLKDVGVELYTCSESYVKGALTSSTGYFAMSDDAGSYKIKLDVYGTKYKLVDNEDHDCFFLVGNINLGTLNLNNGVDCSAYDYSCYEGNTKLWGCYYDNSDSRCHCYAQECQYGCTDGFAECDAGYAGSIIVDVDDTDGKAIDGALVFLNDDLSGIADKYGKLTVNAPFGQNSLEVDCPDHSLCESRNIYVDGTEYQYFDCYCEYLDTDRDGYSNNEERIIGTDPYDSNSNLLKAYTSFEYSKGCWDFTPLFSGLFSDSEVTSIVSQLNGSQSSYNLMFEDDVEKVIADLDMDSSKLVNDKRRSLQMLSESSDIRTVSKDGSVILIFTDDETGVTSVFGMHQACVGQVVGILTGAGYGLKDDIVGIWDLGKLVVTGLWHIMTRQKQLSSLWGDFKHLISSIGGLWQQKDELINSFVVSTFSKGKWVMDKTGVETGTESYISFQLGFFGGFIAGYIVEQIVLFEVIIAKASAAFKAIAKGVKLTDKITDAARALTRIGSSFGGDVASKLSRLKIWKFAVQWADEVQDALALLAKNLDETWFVQKSSSYIEKVSNNIADYRRYVSGLCSVAAGTQGPNDCVKAAMEGLEKAIRAKKSGDLIMKIIHDWPADAINGLRKTFDELGDEVMYRVLSGTVDDDILRDAFKAVNRYDGAADILYDTSKVRYLPDMDNSIIRYLDDTGQAGDNFKIFFTDDARYSSRYISDTDSVRYSIKELSMDPDMFMDFTVGHEILHRKKFFDKG